MVANTARLKTRKQVSTTVNISLWEELQALSKNTRVPVSKYLDEAIMDLLKKYQQ
jgi:predicted DNA-binding protein